MIYVSTILQIGQLMFGIVCLTMLYCPTQLTCSFKSKLDKSGNTNLLYMILKQKFKEPEVEVGIRISISICVSIVDRVYDAGIEAKACARKSSTSTSTVALGLS